MSETARKGLDEAEAGDKDGASLVNKEEKKHPAETEAVEQEREDGPEGRGVAR